MSIKPYLLALTQGAYAHAAPTGEITPGQLRPALGCTRFPPNVTGVRALLAAVAGDGPVDVVLVVDERDDDPELLGVAIAEQLAGVARVRGVALVARSKVLHELAQVQPGITGDANDDIVIAAVNTLTGGEFSADHGAEAWATALLIVGMGMRFASTPMLELLCHRPALYRRTSATGVPVPSIDGTALNPADVRRIVIDAPITSFAEVSESNLTSPATVQHPRSPVSRRVECTSSKRDSKDAELSPLALTLEETARVLNVSVGQARSMLARGLIPFFRTGPGPRAPVRVLRADVDEAARRHFSNQPAPSARCIDGNDPPPADKHLWDVGSDGQLAVIRSRSGTRVAKSKRRPRTQDGQDLDALLAEVGLKLK